MKKIIPIFAAALMLSSPLQAVLATDTDTDTDSNTNTNTEDNFQFASEVVNEGEPIEGGTLRVAFVSSTVMSGLFNDMLWTNIPDGSVVEYFNPGLFGWDENFTLDDSGFGQVELDPENNQATITIPEGHTWHDGEPITIDDVIFPYYVVGHADYTGIRYGNDYRNVVGMEDYHAGDTDTIEGLERVDDYTLRVTYHTMNNGMTQAGGGISSYIEPEHVLADVPVGELEDSEFVRQTPVGFGPFIVDSITPGESVVFRSFENYYKGEPQIDEIVLEVVNPASIIAELRAGNYDISSLPTAQYEEYEDAENFDIIGYISNEYDYVGFKHGSWNDETEEIEMDESRIVRNKALRHAMAHAIDNNAVAQEFFNGLYVNANSFVSPNFTAFYNPDQPYYEYDPDRAREILAEAGFVDQDGDGFVEDPDGEPFTLNFASMAGGNIQEPLTLYYLQSWQEIGLDIQLLDGNLIEYNNFYERVGNDDPEIDVFLAAWTIGGNPSPSGLYGRGDAFNYIRWGTEEQDHFIAEIDSEKSFDEEFRQNIFYEWQAYMMEELPAIPTTYRSQLTAVNKRVSNYETGIGSEIDWTQVYLLSEEPIAE